MVVFVDLLRGALRQSKSQASRPIFVSISTSNDYSISDVPEYCPVGESDACRDAGSGHSTTVRESTGRLRHEITPPHTEYNTVERHEHKTLNHPTQESTPGGNF